MGLCCFEYSFVRNVTLDDKHARGIIGGFRGRNECALFFF